MAEGKSKFPMYKGKPLVRSGDLLFYGDMKDPYVVRMQVRSKKAVKPVLSDGEGAIQSVGDLQVADKVFVQLLNTDINVSPQKAVVKTGEKPSLFTALDLGYVWLQQALRENN
ncbi:MAG: hypothetical protein IJ861_00725 [Clostridia bacterium]|nr:hypothetical protein [Clostridia bacterium]